MVFSEDAAEQYCACWALASLAELSLWTNPAQLGLLERLFRLWSGSQDFPIRYMAGYAFASQQLLPRDKTNWCATVARSEIEGKISRYGTSGLWMDRPATLVVAWYSRMLDDREIASRARELLPKAYPPVSLTLRQLLEQIGESAERTE